MGARFQELFHSPPGVLFTFPSRYWYAIGQTGMLRLTQRSGLIHAGFHEARATWDNTIGRRLTSRYGAGTLYGQAFKPVPLASRFMTPARPVGTGTRDPTTPATQPPTGITRNRFGLIQLSLATTHGVSLPAGTEMFHFPAYPPRERGAGP